MSGSSGPFDRLLGAFGVGASGTFADARPEATDFCVSCGRPVFARQRVVELRLGRYERGLVTDEARTRPDPVFLHAGGMLGPNCVTPEALEEAIKAVGGHASVLDESDDPDAVPLLKHPRRLEIEADELTDAYAQAALESVASDDFGRGAGDPDGAERAIDLADLEPLEIPNPAANIPPEEKRPRWF